jgi:hypothetical protein
MRGVYFNGKQRYRPGAFSKVDVSSATASTIGALRVLAFYGESQGGQPGTMLYFNDPVAAAATLRGGDLLTAMQVAWSPSKTLPGADLIVAIRVNPATTSALALKDATPTTAINITSRDWGVWTTGISVAVAAGTNASTKKVTVTFGTDIEIFDNLADNDAVVKALNANSKYVTAVKAGSTVIANAASAPLVGGIDGTTTSTQWDAALSAFATKKVHGLLPVTSDATVHAACLAHCNLLSDSRKPRRMFAGHALGENKAAVLTRAVNLSSHRAVQVTPGMKKFGTTLSAVFTAAAIAGMWAGAERTEPLTSDLIDCQGLEVVYTESTNDFADFENGGVLAIADVDGLGYKVEHAITTHLADDNPVRMELLKDSLADEIDDNIRAALEAEFVGHGGVKGAQTSITNRTTSLLNAMRDKQNWIVEGVDDAGNVVPAYRNLQVQKSGTVFSVSYEASIIDPINFILITSRFTA